MSEDDPDSRFWVVPKDDVDSFGLRLGFCVVPEDDADRRLWIMAENNADSSVGFDVVDRGGCG